MKIKTSELTGSALDWAVAKCEDRGGQAYLRDGKLYEPLFEEFLCYSTNWAQGGAIIEREGIGINAHMDKEEWIAEDYWNQIQVEGETALIAAMRCYVMFKLGDEADVPDELGESK